MNIISIIGNPNTGKTTLFNMLTGKNERVGNWSGVTVEKKTGVSIINSKLYKIIDLPGLNSFSSNTKHISIDEQITCKHLLDNKFDIIINIIDFSHLENNLYLSTQLLEANIPMIIVINMHNIVMDLNVEDIKKISKLTKCPVVIMSSNKKHSIDLIKKNIQKLINQKKYKIYRTEYSIKFNLIIKKIYQYLKNDFLLKDKNINYYWIIFRFLEKDQLIRKILKLEEKTILKIDHAISKLEKSLETESDFYLANQRHKKTYNWIQQTKKLKDNKKHFFITKKIDTIIINRWIGIPVFLLIMYLIFQCTISFGGAFQPIFDTISRIIFVQGIENIGHTIGLPIWIITIFSRGIGLGLNTVITFIPQISILFFMLSFLENSGYITRAAFVMDKIMQLVGLTGKTFLPLIIGFGCNVPGIIATRSLESKKDRLLSIFISPFMSCTARLSIFAIFSTAFFHKNAPFIIFSLYFLGIFIALLTLIILKLTFLKAQEIPFILDLPLYRFPNIKHLFLDSFVRLKNFLFGAGKTIIPICMLIGLLNSFQWNGRVVPEEKVSSSILSDIGKTITPIFYPIGISYKNWPATVGLITGILAKEVVIGTLNTLYTSNNMNIALSIYDKNKTKEKKYISNFQFEIFHALKETKNNIIALIPFISSNSILSSDENYISNTAIGNMITFFKTPLASYSYMIFILLYVPCISTIATIRREVNFVWSILSLTWSLVIAYSVSVIFYQLFSIKEHIAISVYWIISMLIFLTFIIFIIKKIANNYINASKLNINSEILNCKNSKKCKNCHKNFVIRSI